MKKVQLTICGLLIALFISAANPLSDRFNWIPVSTIYPYYGCKVLPADQRPFVKSVGFLPEDRGSLPLYIYLNIQGTETVAVERGCMFRKFIPQNKSFVAMCIMLGDSDWIRNLLVTFTPSGEMIDYKEVSYGFDSMLYKQWKIESDMKVTVYQLKPTPTTSIPLEQEFTTINMQRIDTEYQIDSSGHFVQLSQRLYQPEDYTYDEILDENKNIWQGNEVPL